MQINMIADISVCIIYTYIYHANGRDINLIKD